MPSYLPNTLEMLVSHGANITIEDSTYLPQTLLHLAQIAKQTGAHITVGGNYLPATLEQLARVAGNNLTIIVRRK